MITLNKLNSKHIGFKIKFKFNFSQRLKGLFWTKATSKSKLKQHLHLKSAPSNKPQIMPSSVLQILSSQFDIQLLSPQEFKNGNNLMLIALKTLYNDSNEFLSSKLSELQVSKGSASPLNNKNNKAGNNVLIINSLLKHIKSDDSIKKQTWIRQLTFYNLLEEQQTMCKFIQWMIEMNQLKNHENDKNSRGNEPFVLNSMKQQEHDQQSRNLSEKQTLPLKINKFQGTSNFYNKMTEQQVDQMSSNRFRNIEIENQRFKTQENEKQANSQFENLYFASNLKNKPIEEPIVISPQKGDKIVRKGSFKLLKPKVNFIDENNKNEIKEDGPKQICQQEPNFSSKNTIQTKSLSQKHSRMLLNQSSSQFYEPQELKEISMIQPSNHGNSQIQQNMNISQPFNIYYQQGSQLYQSEELGHNKSITSTPVANANQLNQQGQNRKTIPKNLSKPPLYRSSSVKNKENTQNGPSALINDKEKTVQQSIKKKSFFNFSDQCEPFEKMVSTFNYDSGQKQSIEPMGSQKELHCNAISNVDSYLLQQPAPENFRESSLQSSKSKMFSRMKLLRQDQKSQLKQFMSLQMIDMKINEDRQTVQSYAQFDEKILDENQGQHHEKKFSDRQSRNNHQSSKINDNDQNKASSKILKLKNHFLQKQLYDLQKQIQKQSSSLQLLQNQAQNPTQQNHLSSHKRSISSVNHGRQNSLNNQTTSNKNAFFIDSGIKKSNRKVSKITLKQLDYKETQMIIDWLDGLHFVQKSRILSPTEDVFERFKNGTKFVELCNHYIGRNRPLPYFANPKKNAEIHSNYSKVFQFLKTYSQWDHPELLFSFELFIPFCQSSAVWNLLWGMFKLFNNKTKTVNRSASKNNNELLIHTKQNQTARKRSIEKQFKLIENDSSCQKKQNHLIERNIPKVMQPIYTNRKVLSTKKQHSSASLTSNRKQSTFSKPIQFVKQIPEDLKHKDLVQQSEEHFDCLQDIEKKHNEANMNVYFEGYKDKYMRKTLQNSCSKEKLRQYGSLQTPKKSIQPYNEQTNQLKQQSFVLLNAQSTDNKSVRKSSSKKIIQNQLKKIQHSSTKLLSAKKGDFGYEPIRSKHLPKISLNMQMKVQKILKHFKLEKIVNTENSQKLVKFQLLQDPIRNGTLIHILLGKFIPVFEGKYVRSPSSIQHCRQNYMNFYCLIKNKYGQEGFEMVEKYMQYTEDILKGQKSLFYGIAYSLTLLMQRKGFKMNQQQETLNQQHNRQNSSNSHIATTTRVEKQRIESITHSFCQNHIQWVRYLQRVNPRVISYKIRTQEDFKRSIFSGQFFYAFTQNNSSFKPIYVSPVNQEERQANLKKIFGYLIQNRILFQREDVMKIRPIAQQDTRGINSLIFKLVTYSVMKYGVEGYKPVNFATSANNQNSSKIGNIMMAQQGFTKNSNETKSVALTKYLRQENQCKNPASRLQTTTAEYMNESNQYNEAYNNHSDKHSYFEQHKKMKQQQQDQKSFEVEIPWLRKLGYSNCSLSINNGYIFIIIQRRILLCRLISKLTRTNIKFNENISTDAKLPKAQSLGYIRKSIKLIPGFKFDQSDIYEANQAKTLEIYDLIKEKFRNTYEMTRVLGGGSGK